MKLKNFEMPKPEVLIYVDKVKTFFKVNDQARKYFINDGDENSFFNYLTEISEKNFEKTGEPELNIEQLELLRKTIIAQKIVKSNYFYSEDGTFLFFEDYPPISMN